MKTIYYVPPILVLAIAVAWFTSQKPSEPLAMQETASPSKATKSSRPPAAEENQPTASQQKPQTTRNSPTTEDIGSVLKDPEKRMTIHRDQWIEIALRWLQTDPAAVTAWMDSLPVGKWEVDLIVEIAAKALEQDESATIAWIDAMPESMKGICKRQVMESLFSKMPSQEAFEAKLATFPAAWHDEAQIQWILHGKPTQKSAEQLVMMSKRNPEFLDSTHGKWAWVAMSRVYQEQGKYSEGLALAMEMPNEKDKTWRVEEVTTEWAKKDASAAAQAVNQMQEGPLRDTAVTGIANVLSDSSPTDALAWAGSISNGNQRRATTRKIFETWMINHPAEAAHALQAMPPEERKQIFPGIK